MSLTQSALFVLFAMLVVSVCDGKEEARTLGINAAQWPPYVYNHNDELSGTDIDLLTEVLAELDYHLKGYPLPEKRAGLQIAQGKIDVVAGAAYNELRAKNNLFSITYRTEVIRFAYLPHRHDEFAGKTLCRLLDEGYTLALNTSGWYGESFKREVMQRFPQQLVHVDTVERRLALLKFHRVDLMLDDVEALQFIANKDNTPVAISKHTVHQQDVHFMFSKYSVSPAFVSAFNEVLASKLPARAKNNQSSAASG